MAALKPKKANFRQRAHVNPLNDSTVMECPVSPAHVDWSLLYPGLFPEHRQLSELHLNTSTYPIQFSDVPMNLDFHPDFLDVGCGFGGLSVSLAKTFPEKKILAFEIREKVTNYVGERIRALRCDPQETGFKSVSVMRSNSMKSLVNFIPKASVEKMFFCFPDPHFKQSNWWRRIINDALLSTYAYTLMSGGKIYFVSDVKALYEWMDDCLARATSQFVKVSDASEENDPCVKAICNDTEEGMKVKRGGHPCYFGVYQRL